MHVIEAIECFPIDTIILHTIDQNKLLDLSKLRNWKGAFVSGAKLLLFPAANTLFTLLFSRFTAPILPGVGPQLQGCMMDLGVCSLLLHLEENDLEASARQSVEVEVRPTFLSA